MPPTTHCASRGVRRGLLVLTAGPVSASTGVALPARWSRPNLVRRAEGSASLPFRANPTEGREGLKTMAPIRPDLAARRRGELDHDRGSRRVSSAIDARRRLSTRRADSTRKTAPVGASDPRHAYLRRSYDSPGDAAFQVSGARKTRAPTSPRSSRPGASSVLAAREAMFVLRPPRQATQRREPA